MAESQSLLLWALGTQAPTSTASTKSSTDTTTRAPTVKAPTASTAGPLSKFRRGVRDAAYVWGGEKNIPEDIMKSIKYGTPIKTKRPRTLTTAAADSDYGLDGGSMGRKPNS